MRSVRAILLASLGLAPGPSRAGDIVLNCYLFQTGSGSARQFTRRLDVDSKSATVAIADDYDRSGFRPLGAYGKLVGVDDDRIVFDFASSGSSGRTTINRRDGTFSFSDGRVVMRGTCTPSEL